jgi:hypothetical protein
MVLVREKFFRSKFESIINARMVRVDSEGAPRDQPNLPHWGGRFCDRFRHHSRTESRISPAGSNKKVPIHDRLRPEMIRRVHGAPRPVDPMGWISDREAPEIEVPVDALDSVSPPQENEDMMRGAATGVPAGSEILAPRSATHS